MATENFPFFHFDFHLMNFFFFLFHAEHLKPFNMPTIIRPNRSAGKPPPPAISSSSTHLKVLEKIVPIPVTTTITTAANSRLPQPRSSSPYLADLLDLDLSAEYSPPEPSIPPPAPPSFLLTSSPATKSISSPAAAVASYPATLPPPPSFELDLSDVPSAVALFDYHSSHLGDLNFKVFIEKKGLDIVLRVSAFLSNSLVLNQTLA